MKALPYILLASFFTISIALYIAGCTVPNPDNWYPMFKVIPATLAMICLYAFLQSDNSMSEPTYFFTEDAWMFLFMICIFSAGSLTFVFKHTGKIDNTSLFLHTGGDICAAIGFALFMILDEDDDGINNF